MPDHKALRCDCGYEVKAGTEAELVDEIRCHARTAHGIAFTVEEALLVVLRSQLDLSRESFTTDTREWRLSPNEGGST
jgi:predicted small metal-binding protein